ncbi:peptide deformylase [Aquimarina sp. AD10]|uniref:peptide deformylase n=1 Tax=Aquimarina sp. AD10 TaxID=1714849 RepID=UPI000E4B2664|nr:peptide deformylase [Aquimarina sp. AD10]AXT61318.1 peptide deformylase [Aquimarina sp. AD10]RKN01487.1 peptide deformylase [Aquimarina sp. AD10]
MAILEVIKMGHPTLRKQSELIDENTSSSEFQNFVDDLIQTMRHQNGAGIAAPQVNVLKRIFTMEMTDNPRYPDRHPFPLYVVINPEIECLGHELVDSWEGCLSIPNIRGKLKRYKRIKLKGYDRNGKSFEEELEGFAAIVAQHELDHLNGVLLIDRMDSMKTLTFQEEYEKYWL